MKRRPRERPSLCQEANISETALEEPGLEDLEDLEPKECEFQVGDNVVYPHQCHAGGDLFAIVWHPGERKLYGLNASGPAPAGLTIDYVRERGHETIPERGGLTVTVPGAVAGWAALQQRFGARSLDRVLDPAVGYARDGAPMPRNYVAALSRLADVVAGHSGMRAVFGGSASHPGDVMRQPALARIRSVSWAPGGEDCADDGPKPQASAITPSVGSKAPLLSRAIVSAVLSTVKKFTGSVCQLPAGAELNFERADVATQGLISSTT